MHTEIKLTSRRWGKSEALRQSGALKIEPFIGRCSQHGPDEMCLSCQPPIEAIEVQAESQVKND
jgi:hypothetical protein